MRTRSPLTFFPRLLPCTTENSFGAAHDENQDRKMRPAKTGEIHSRLCHRGHAMRRAGAIPRAGLLHSVAQPPRVSPHRLQNGGGGRKGPSHDWWSNSRSSLRLRNGKPRERQGNATIRQMRFPPSASRSPTSAEASGGNPASFPTTLRPHTMPTRSAITSALYLHDGKLFWSCAR